MPDKPPHPFEIAIQVIQRVTGEFDSGVGVRLAGKVGEIVRRTKDRAREKQYRRHPPEGQTRRGVTSYRRHEAECKDAGVQGADRARSRLDMPDPLLCVVYPRLNG